MTRHPGQRSGIIPIAVELQDTNAVEAVLKDVQPSLAAHANSTDHCRCNARKCSSVQNLGISSPIIRFAPAG
jgi:hypothetical protein